MKRIVLCADDYGQAPEISNGILALVKLRRLTAVSCMVNTPFFEEHAALLNDYHSQLDIGLHFNLTHGAPLSPQYVHEYGAVFPALSTLLKKAFLHKLRVEVIEAECLSQIDRFEKAMGFLPRFIDGHQHVHHFPVIRDAFLRAYEKRLKAARPYVRVSASSSWIKDPKRLVINLTGAYALRKSLISQNIPFNLAFSGVYPFEKADKYPDYFRGFLKEIKQEGLIMCHPGLLSRDPKDPIASARFKEFLYFSSDDFVVDSQNQGVKWTQFG